MSYHVTLYNLTHPPSWTTRQSCISTSHLSLFLGFLYLVRCSSLDVIPLHQAVQSLNSFNCSGVATNSLDFLQCMWAFPLTCIFQGNLQVVSFMGKSSLLILMAHKYPLLPQAIKHSFLLSFLLQQALQRILQGFQPLVSWLALCLFTYIPFVFLLHFIYIYIGIGVSLILLILLILMSSNLSA